MKSLLYKGAATVEVREVPVPRIGADEALVEVEACGLCGTDLLKIFHGGLRPPVPLGHEVAGRIAEVGREVKGFRKGDRVVVAHHVPCLECHYCRRGNVSMCREFKRTNLDPGGFSQFVRVSARHVLHAMLKIPPQVGFSSASQVEPLACVLRNARRLALSRGDTAVVVGLGSIGLMTAQVLARRGVAVVGVDLEAGRIRIAREAGLERAFESGDAAREAALSLTQGRGADALVFTAGTAALVAERLSWLRDGGILNIFASFHPKAAAALDLDEFYRRELSIVSSYSPAPEDLREALRLIAGGAIDLQAQTRHAFSLDRFPDAVRRVRDRRVLKAILLPQKAAREGILDLAANPA